MIPSYFFIFSIDRANSFYHLLFYQMSAEETQIILENLIQLYELLELIIISFDNWLMHTVYFKIFIISSYKDLKISVFINFSFFSFLLHMSMRG